MTHGQVSESVKPRLVQEGATPQTSKSEDKNKILHALSHAIKPLRELELASESVVQPTVLRPILVELKAPGPVQSDGIHPVFTLSSLKKAPGLEAHGAPIFSSSDTENTSRVPHAHYCANKPLREIELANESGVHPTILRPI